MGTYLGPSTSLTLNHCECSGTGTCALYLKSHKIVVCTDVGIK